MLVNFSRLDIPVLPKGWEQIDTAYSSYIATLLLDHSHNNPVVTVFIDLLNKGCEKRKMDSQVSLLDDKGSSPSEGNEQDQDPGVSRRARLRWHLALTLLRNPSLRKQRKHYLAERRNIADNVVHLDD